MHDHILGSCSFIGSFSIKATNLFMIWAWAKWFTCQISLALTDCVIFGPLKVTTFILSVDQKTILIYILHWEYRYFTESFTYSFSFVQLSSLMTHFTHQKKLLKVALGTCRNFIKSVSSYHPPPTPSSPKGRSPRVKPFVPWQSKFQKPPSTPTFRQINNSLSECAFPWILNHG